MPLQKVTLSAESDYCLLCHAGSQPLPGKCVAGWSPRNHMRTPTCQAQYTFSLCLQCPFRKELVSNLSFNLLLATLTEACTIMVIQNTYNYCTMIQNVRSKLYTFYQCIIHEHTHRKNLHRRGGGGHSSWSGEWFTCFCIIHCIWYVYIVTRIIMTTFITESPQQDKEAVNTRERR